MWPNPQETAYLVTFTVEILMENVIFGAVDTKFWHGFKMANLHMKANY